MQKRTTLFDVGMKDAKFMSAREKALVLRQWESFLKSSCAEEHFTKALYLHLIQHCSFIAHYDRGGFYQTYFVRGEDTAHFLTQFDREKGCLSVEYGDTYWLTNPDYADINSSMVEVAAKYISTLTTAAENRQRDADIARARALLAKHGLTLKED